jgi:hypothetical protein
MAELIAIMLGQGRDSPAADGYRLRTVSSHVKLGMIAITAGRNNAAGKQSEFSILRYRNLYLVLI